MATVIAARFELGDLIARGGMGTVYRGLDRQTGRTVAIKIIRPELTAAVPDSLARFEREGELLRTLNHPNIVQLVATPEIDGQRYLVTEFVAGGSLADRIAQEPPLTASEVIHVGLELSDALARAHHLKIIHRDLKPANVLLAEDGSVRLTDFGVARLKQSDLTQWGTLVGTPAYLAPEVLSGFPADARSDLWSLGVLLFEALTGDSPFGGESPGALVAAILTKPTPDLEALRPDLPIGLVDLIYRLLEKNPDARIGSARQVAADLEKLAEDGQISRQNAVSSGLTTRLLANQAQLPTPQTPHAVRHNLMAQTTPFVGREAELSELAKLLADPSTPLITVLGSGGVGKTRLGFEAAVIARDQHPDLVPDGVFFIPLAPLIAPEQLIPTVAEAVGFLFASGGTDKRTPVQQLADYFQEKKLLLVLDNFEHLLPAAEIVSSWLSASSGLKLLVTSRERLNLQSETLFRLEGLDFPDWKTADDAFEYSAVKLFLQSARRVQPGYTLPAEDLTYLARICRKVEGLPLAILLAAAWIDTLTLKEVSEEIERTADFLATEQRDVPTRQRSMRAVFDYSWRLLSEDEQVVFARLSIFRGGFAREAAQTVAGASLRTLTALVNKSLVRRSTNGRYDVHELLRQYATEPLAATGQAAAIRRAHSDYYLSLMHDCEVDLKGHDQAHGLNAIETDLENIRLAWLYAVEQRNGTAVGGAVESMRLFFDIRSRHREGERMLQVAQAAFVDTEKEYPLLHARIASSRCFLLAIDDLDRNNEVPGLIELCAARFAASSDAAGVAFCQFVSAIMLMRIQPMEAVQQVFQASYNYWKQSDNLYLAADVLSWLAVIEVEKKTAKALPSLQEAVAAARRAGATNLVGWSLTQLSIYLFQVGQIDQAENHNKEAYAAFTLLGEKKGSVWSSLTTARIALARGQFEQAEQITMPLVPLTTDLSNGSLKMSAYSLLSLLSVLRLKNNEQAQLCYPVIDMFHLRRTAYVSWPSALFAAMSATFLMLDAQDREAAESYYHLVLRAQRDFHEAMVLTFLLPMGAVWVSERRQSTRAAEILGLAAANPLTAWGWLERAPRLDQFRAHLRKLLGQDGYDAACLRGKSLDLDEVVAELLTDLPPDAS